MALKLVGRIATGDLMMDYNLADLGVLSLGGETLLVATTRQGGGISTWALSEKGRLATLADSSYFTVSGIGLGSFDAVELGTRTDVILSGVGSGKLIRFSLSDSGVLSKEGKIDLPGLTTQNHDTLLAVPLSNGNSAVYTVVAETGALTGWLSSAAGILTGEIGLGGAVTPFAADSPVVMAQAVVGGTRYLLAADDSLTGVRSYEVKAGTGKLAHVDSSGAEDGLGIGIPTAMETVSAHGETWVVLAAAGSNSLSVMKLRVDGQLVPTDHVLDTRATRFDGVTALEVVEVDGHVFVLAGGADDGISLFYLLPDGTLVHRQTLIHEDGLGLENVTAITAARVGSEIQIFVSSGTAAGISQFSLPLSDIGTVVLPDGSSVSGGAPTGTGTADGHPRLLGGSGDDILVTDTDGGVLTGRAGADIFVLSPTEKHLEITDFTPGVDQLDLSHLPMLRSIEQLVVTPLRTGIRLTHNTTQIDIHSQSGAALTLADLWPSGFSAPDRFSLPEPPPDPGTDGDDLITGTDAADVLKGLAGDDVIYGEAGADQIVGGLGADRLYGNEGDDRIWGGKGADTVLMGNGRDVFEDHEQEGSAGADTVYGGNGQDTILGGGGDDRFWGGKGADQIRGGDGDDRILGGNHADKLYGEAGNDLLEGGNGNDEMYGGLGDDTIDGGAGADRIWGGKGADTVLMGNGRDVFEDHEQGGSAGADTVYGGNGRDTILGGGGDDTFWGEKGADLIRGGDGNDRILGGTHGDELYGGDGDDRIFGGSGNDRIWGDDGADTLEGGSGGDRLFGGRGWDVIHGGDGADELHGEAGNDQLEGGKGADQFVFAALHGTDKITDFEPEKDLIVFDVAGLTIDDLDILNNKAGVKISSDEGIIVLHDLTMDDLTTDSFLFL